MANSLPTGRPLEMTGGGDNLRSALNGHKQRGVHISYWSEDATVPKKPTLDDQYFGMKTPFRSIPKDCEERNMLSREPSPSLLEGLRSGAFLRKFLLCCGIETNPGPDTHSGVEMLERTPRDFSDARTRLLSFKTWPKPGSFPTPTLFASTGFFFTNQADEVECFSCGARSLNWTPVMSPHAVHAKISPFCRMVLGIEARNKPMRLLWDPDISQSEILPRSSMSGSPGNLDDLFPKRCLPLSNTNAVRGTIKAMPLGDPDQLLVDRGQGPGNMRYEGERLSTFAQWPKCGIISPSSLAKSGFYYEGQGDTVTCAFCRGSLSGWLRGEEADAEHRKHFGARCRLLRGDLVDNVPHRGDNAAHAYPSLEAFNTMRRTNVTWTTRMRHEDERLSTFTRWPKHEIVSPSALAKAGFYFKGQGDTVTCAFCQGSLGEWGPGDEAEAEHRRHFGLSCRFLRGDLADNVPLQGNQDRRNTSMHSESARLATYKDWPKRSTVSPFCLARTGLYYTGPVDRVECAFCHGKLQGWMQGDVPEVEHLKHFGRRCGFLQGNLTGNIPIDTSDRVTAMPPSSITVKDILECAAANVVRSLGVNASIVERAAKILLETTGRVPDINTLLESCTMFDDASTGLGAGAAATLPISVTLEHILQCEAADQVRSFGVSADLVTRAANYLLLTAGGLPDTTTLLEACFLTAEDEPPRPTQQPLKNCKDQEPEDPVGSKAELNQGAVANIEERFLELHQKKVCKICLDEEIDVVLIPCGHLICCRICAPALNKCPICRVNIERAVRTYLA